KEKLEKAFAQLMARHDSLRTSFHMEMGQPVQVVHKELPFAFDEVEDVSPGQGDASLVLLKKFVRPFDLTKAPLLRAGLVELQAGTHLLMMDMHHIISDGTSMGIIAGELAQLYAGESLPDLRVQYKDFAFRQNGVFATGVVDGLREYWQEVFPGDVPLLDLPIDWERPEIQSFKGGSLNLQLDPESTSRLKEIASGCKTSLFMVLLAIYNVMLSIYGRCEDVVVGTPTAGRSHPDLEHMVGMFVNTLALRNFPKGELTFTAFLEDVKKHVLDAFVNQDFQFEELVDMLEIRRDLGRNPLFDTVFTLQNIEMPEIKTENLVFKQVEYEDDIAKFDVMLTAYETEEGMGMDLQYCSALFKRETVERMAGHFLNIIRDVSADPLIRLNTVSMLSEAERHLLVVTFNDTETEYPSDKTLHGIFSEQAAATPANFALSGPNNAGTEDSLFYYELNEKTEHLGLLLREKGVGPGQIVGILMDRTVEMVVGILAVLKAGGAYMPLDPEYPVDRISFMLKDSAAPVLLTSRAVYGDGSLVGDWQGELGFIGDYEELVSVSYATGGKALPSPAKPDDLAYVIYTSGTTGRPKGVLVDHRNVVRLMKNRSFQFDFREGDVWTVFHSFCFDFSVWEM
ncbi:MAG: AMP-binding protein, partial [bacterium]|nr:AMP-binding protein [bacterium]